MSVIDFQKRPIVDLSILCEVPPQFPKPLCITLPGGVEICPQPSLMHLGVMEYARMAIGMANVALAPLVPFFRVVDVIVSIQNVLSVIPDILGPPPNPAPLIDALAKLLEKMKFLLRMVPALSVPIMILNLLDVVILNLEGFISELHSLARFKRQIQQAQIGAADAVGLVAILKCAQSQYDAQMGNLEHMFATINPIIQIVNLLAQLAQLGDPFPLKMFESVDTTFAGGPEDIAAVLQTIVDKLSFVRAAIPI